jgi:DNA-3-methyladenine glycosylase
MSETGRLVPLARSYYDRDAETVARGLLGTWLVRRHFEAGGERVQIGRVVETEAYLGPHDLAAHSARGRTARTEVMFGPPGHAYVYLIYGMHHCLNAVTEEAGTASAVLIRSVEPVLGIDLNPRGPGRLCKALGIDRTFNGLDLTGPGLPPLAFVEPEGGSEAFVIDAGPRIGVEYAGEWAARPLRFTVRGSAWLSRPASRRG